MRNYGFIPPKIDETHYVLGGVATLGGQEVLQANGQWDAYIPQVEIQAQRGIETYNCSAFGTTSILEFLHLKIYGEQINSSDRYLGIMAGTKPPGNDPHTVVQAIRHDGLVPEEYLPFSTNIKTVEEYYSFLYGDETRCTVEGQRFLQRYQVGHEWVWTGIIAKEERTAKMKEALQYSPLGVSVSAWYQEDGVYVDKGKLNNHWCVCYGWNDEGWKIFDSYDSSLKTLSYDHKIQFCKRYSLTKKTTRHNWFIDLLIRLGSIFKWPK